MSDKTTNKIGWSVSQDDGGIITMMGKVPASIIVCVQGLQQLWIQQPRRTAFINRKFTVEDDTQ